MRKILLLSIALFVATEARAQLNVTAAEATSAQRTVYFRCVDAADGITAETGEAGGQPQISTNGAAFTNTGIGVLGTYMGHGIYPAVLTQAAVTTVGDVILGAFKSAATAECIMVPSAVVVVAYDPYSTGLGLVNVSSNVVQWNTAAIAAPDASGMPKVTINDGTCTGCLDTASGVALAKDHTGANLATASVQSGLAAFASGFVMVQTTIATLASQTSFTLTAGSADNNAYRNLIITVQDSSTAVQKAVGVVSVYTGSTKTVTLLANPNTFTMAVGDIVTILAIRSGI